MITVRPAQLAWLSFYLAVLAFGQTTLTRVERVAERVGGLPVFQSAQAGLMLDGTVKASSDGGRTWSTAYSLPAIQPGEWDEVEFLAADLVVVLRQREPNGTRLKELLFTRDRGRTWSALDAPEAVSATERWYFSSYALDPDAADVWLGGQRAIPGSTPARNIECGMAFPDFAWAPTVFHRPLGTSVGTVSWKQQVLPKKNGCDIPVMRFVDRAHGVAAAGGSVFYTENGGINWSSSRVRFGDQRRPFMPQQLDFAKDQPRYGWLTYSDGGIFITRDGGKNWVSVRPPDLPTEMGPWGGYYLARPGAALFIGDKGKIYETRDGGGHWTKIVTPELIHSVSGFGLDCWLVGESKALYHVHLRG